MYTDEPPTPMTNPIKAVVLSVMSSITPATAAWEPLPPLPEPNGGFICGVIGRGIVVAGGTNWVDGTKRWLDKIWWLDPKALKWMAKGTLPRPLAYAVSTPWKDGVIVAGGFDGTRARAEVWHLDSSFELNPLGHLKTATCIAQGGICTDGLIVVGGTNDPANLGALSAAAQGMRLPGGAAEEIASPGGAPRGTGASATLGGHLFIFGGATPDPVKQVANLNDASEFNCRSRRWQTLPAYPIHARGVAGAPLDRQHVYLAGGYGGDADDFTDKAFIYDVKTGAYAASIPLPLANCTTLVTLGDHVYALGGEPEKKVRTDKCWRIKVEELLH